MVKMRARDYSDHKPKNDELTESEVNTAELNTPTTEPDSSSLTKVPTCITSMPTKHTMSSTIPEWKTIAFRSKVMTIVRNLGDQLKKDGSNYCEWEFRIRDLIDDYTEPGWLDQKDAHIDDPTGDRIVLMMIKYSIDTDVVMKINKISSAAAAMETIKALFYFPSRSKQVACWQNILGVKLVDDEDLDTCLRAISDGFDELEHDGFVFTKDSLVGLYYELAMPERYSEVTSQLNSTLRAKLTETITANQVEELIRSRWALLPKRNDDMQDLIPSFSNINFGKSRQPTDKRAQRPRYQLPFRVTNQETTKRVPINTCLACSEKGHWAWACPYKPRNAVNSTPRKPDSTPQQWDSWRQGTSKPLPRVGRNLADTQMKVNFIDVDGNPFEANVTGPLPEGIWMSEGYLEGKGNDDDLGDTGATHNVTGDAAGQ
ncbi:hypothetical protein CROQUDRAFT_107648 [Cronartium quercuum f. sp. fusiforme G11]|uniref:CCHC-type domain-containing protein n=1 Tax=Cronartium quercuum f. sp. fusiforme G11 TaxID=708437 RepID=A0A9P6NHH7_9BASI|nr:hypothetical protein CROQUDRAFT_107648 [Cronartium quercuum f. sp. fusiforme G11]